MLHLLGAIAALAVGQTAATGVTLTNQDPINSAGTSTQPLTVPSYTSTAAAGTNGFVCTTAGCRYVLAVDDYFADDGSGNGVWTVGSGKNINLVFPGASGQLRVNGAKLVDSSQNVFGAVLLNSGGVEYDGAASSPQIFFSGSGAYSGTYAYRLFKDNQATDLVDISPAGLLTTVGASGATGVAINDTTDTCTLQLTPSVVAGTGVLKLTPVGSGCGVSGTGMGLQFSEVGGANGGGNIYGVSFVNINEVALGQLADTGGVIVANTQVSNPGDVQFQQALRFNKHLSSNGASPTIAAASGGAPACLGSGPSYGAATGGDGAFIFSITTGSTGSGACSGGTKIATVTLANAYSSSSYVVMCAPADAAHAGASAWYGIPSAAGTFDFYNLSGLTLGNSTALTFQCTTTGAGTTR